MSDIDNILSSIESYATKIRNGVTELTDGIINIQNDIINQIYLYYEGAVSDITSELSQRTEEIKNSISQSVDNIYSEIKSYYFIDYKTEAEKIDHTYEVILQLIQKCKLIQDELKKIWEILNDPSLLLLRLRELPEDERISKEDAFMNAFTSIIKDRVTQLKQYYISQFQNIRDTYAMIEKEQKPLA